MNMFVMFSMKRLLIISVSILLLTSLWGCKKNTLEKIEGTWERYFVVDPLFNDNNYTGQAVQLNEHWIFDQDGRLTVRQILIRKEVASEAKETEKFYAYEMESYNRFRRIDNSDDSYMGEQIYKIQKLNDEVMLLIRYGWNQEEGISGNITGRKLVPLDFLEFSKLED